jgi:hypothetical protein
MPNAVPFTEEYGIYYTTGESGKLRGTVSPSNAKVYANSSIARIIDGNYSFAHIPTATVNLYARKEGFFTHKENLPISPTTETIRNISLVPIPRPIVEFDSFSNTLVFSMPDGAPAPDKYRILIRRSPFGACNLLSQTTATTYDLSGLMPIIRTDERFISFSVVAVYEDDIYGDDTSLPSDPLILILSASLEEPVFTQRPKVSSLGAYPNPFNGSTFIEAPSDMVVSVFTADGRLVGQGIGSFIFTAPSDLPSGLLHIKAENADKTLLTKTLYIK